MTASLDVSERVILHVCVTDLPGSPQKRHTFIGDLFCKQVLQRDFNNMMQIPSRDHIHLPPDFDTDKPLRRWFIIDLNVSSRLTKDEVKKLPHQVYTISRQGNEWLFIPRPTYVERVRDYCTTYYWGGRQEQDWMDGIREGKKFPEDFLPQKFIDRSNERLD